MLCSSNVTDLYGILRYLYGILWYLQHPSIHGMQIGGRQDTPAYLLKNLKPGHQVPGPAILIDDISTIVVEPKCTAVLTANLDIKVEVQRPKVDKATLLTECDPVQLAIFSHRYTISDNPQQFHLCDVCSYRLFLQVPNVCT